MENEIENEKMESAEKEEEQEEDKPTCPLCLEADISQNGIKCFFPLCKERKISFFSQ